jgi:hypothetical protein
MNHEDNDSIASSRRSRGPKGLGEHAARAIEQSLGPGPGRGAVEEELFLKDWLTVQGCLIPDADWVFHKLISSGTAEHEVRYRAHDHRAIKRTLPGTFGNIPKQIHGKWEPLPATPSEYLSRLALQNEVFNDEIILEGAMLHDGPSMIIGAPKGVLLLVISQPWIDAANEHQPYPSEEQLTPYLQERGFKKLIGSFFGWIKDEEQLVVLDAKPDNFILTPDGIIPIDLLITEYELAA